MTEPLPSARPSRATVVVVGAGISGLTCAYRVHGARPDIDVVVLEAGGSCGGKIRTTPIGGQVIDEAADAFLARVPAAVGLCRELGLGSLLTSPAERRAFVYRHGALHRLPEGLVLGVPTDLDALRASGIISGPGVDRALDDLTLPRDLPDAPEPGHDETVGQLVRRRVGDEVFEALVGPLLSGVNAGDADALSLEAGAPQLAAAARDDASLILGLRAQVAAARRVNPDPDAPVFFGLHGGTQTLTDALADALPAESIRTGSPVSRISESPSPSPSPSPSVSGDADERRRLHVELVDGTTIDADSVVLATPSFVTARLLEGAAPSLARELGSLEWASVVLVTFVVPRSAVEHPLDGSGFLVSEGEGLVMTACSFGSSKWAHWKDPTPDGNVVLRVSAGRHGDDRAWSMGDDELIAALLDELRTTIGLSGMPVATRVSRWERALPQYRPGHLGRARAWKEAAADVHPGLLLTGASYFGLGIPACITDATDTARAVVELIDISEARS